MTWVNFLKLLGWNTFQDNGHNVGAQLRVRPLRGGHMGPPLQKIML